MKAVKQSSSSSSQVVAPSGTLRKTPFANLLVALLDQRKTGTLRLIDPHGNVHALVHFVTGLPVGARVPSAGGSLMQSLIPLCSLAVGEYLFVDDRDEVGDADGSVIGRVDPVALISAAMRGPMREDAVQHTLEALGSSLLRLHPRASLRRYGFTAQEQQVVECLERAPASLQELLEQPGAQPRVVQRVVYVLRITRGITPLTVGRRVMSGTMQRAAAMSIHDQLRASKIPSEEQSASVSEAERILQSYAPGQDGRYHVRYPDGETVETPSQDTAGDLSVEMPFGDPFRKERVLTGNGEHSSPGDSQGQRGVDAETHRREAERLLRRSNYQAALGEAHQALRADPSARHEALYAWLLYLCTSERSSAYARAMHHLDRALQRDPNCEQAHYYKAYLLKGIGDLKQAYAHFKRVVRLNPGHQEAAREVRLYELRRRSTSSGLIGRFFGNTGGTDPNDKS